MRFAFDVMASGKQFANRKDVTGLVSLLHSEKARVKDTTNTLMGIMDPHNRDKISFDTFRYEMESCPVYLPKYNHFWLNPRHCRRFRGNARTLSPSK